MAGGCVGHGAGYGERMNAISALLIDVDESQILRRLAADSRTGDDRGALADFVSPFDFCIANSFARGNHRELGESIHVIESRWSQMSRRVEVARDGGIVEAQGFEIWILDRADRGTAVTQR